MPFKLPVDKAASLIAERIEHGVSYTVLPWQMAVVARLMRMLPNWMFDRLAVRAGRKPRGLPL